MNFSRVLSAELHGIEARLVEVETDINVGLHAFTIVGLADKALSEAKERVSAAIKNSGFKPPARENRKIVVNLAPADVRKTGSQYDLAIAIGYLMATGQMKTEGGANLMIAGELSLEGTVRPVAGALNFAYLARKLGFETLLVPRGNAAEAALVTGIAIIPIDSLQEAVGYREARRVIIPQPPTAPPTIQLMTEEGIDFSDIKGQDNAKRALTIAAAGGHNLLMIGSPGGGKTMLAQAINSILPRLGADEVIEVTKIYSAAGQLTQQPYISQRPFRSPHQTASPAAVIGGGAVPRPGEISLAHRGVLFLDEFPEFRRDLLESLRQPLESGRITVSRAKDNLIFPARFILVAAMNPCPCGYADDQQRECRCTANEVSRYKKKVSGPLLDRIDLQITVPRVSVAALRANRKGLSESAAARQLVAAARTRQHERLGGARVNAGMNAPECDTLIQLDHSAREFIDTVVARSLISARGYYRLLKTAQTVADLEKAPTLSQEHLAEAFGYRLKE